MIRWKNKSCTLLYRNHMPSALRPWPLFHQKKFPTGIIHFFLIKSKYHLEREKHISIQILMETVVAAFFVF
jgi:hypothetical protein